MVWKLLSLVCRKFSFWLYSRSADALFALRREKEPRIDKRNRLLITRNSNRMELQSKHKQTNTDPNEKMLKRQIYKELEKERENSLRVIYRAPVPPPPQTVWTEKITHRPTVFIYVMKNIYAIFIYLFIYIYSRHDGLCIRLMEEGVYD